MTRLLLPALCAAALCASLPVVAKPSARAIDQQMMRLDPDTRFEQRCNRRAIGAIRKTEKGYSPDEVVAYAFTKSEIKAGEVLAPGAAIRSQGKWYHLSYHCRPTHDGLGIESFTYTLGPLVPRSQWDDHYLVP